MYPTDFLLDGSALNKGMVKTLQHQPLALYSDPEAAIGLLDLIHTQLDAFATRGDPTLDNPAMEVATAALRAVTARVGIEFTLPFTNFTDFSAYWVRNGAANNDRARRKILTDLFNPARAQLLELEDASLDNLADPVIPHTTTGWTSVDLEIRELRRRFQTAATPQDYRALGTNCIGVLESLSRTVYDQVIHLRAGEDLPPVDKTKFRISRFIEDAAAGPDNEKIRGLLNKANDLAQSVKHSASSRRDAGIAADAVILLANILRRLYEEPDQNSTQSVQSSKA
ncbi:hypothetical protein [Nocardia salmonicida]|uniref:hypothetical protein n=1 Tax=Nocardia salmonicida TaxID=53431 RepID=UPI003CF82656